jgi:hypothetical protein
MSKSVKVAKKETVAATKKEPKTVTKRVIKKSKDESENVTGDDEVQAPTEDVPEENWSRAPTEEVSAEASPTEAVQAEATPAVQVVPAETPVQVSKAPEQKSSVKAKQSVNAEAVVQTEVQYNSNSFDLTPEKQKRLEALDRDVMNKYTTNELLELVMFRGYKNQNPTLFGKSKSLLLELNFVTQPVNEFRHQQSFNSNRGRGNQSYTNKPRNFNNETRPSTFFNKPRNFEYDLDSTDDRKQTKQYTDSPQDENDGERFDSRPFPNRGGRFNSDFRGRGRGRGGFTQNKE